VNVSLLLLGRPSFFSLPGLSHSDSAGRESVIWPNFVLAFANEDSGLIPVRKTRSYFSFSSTTSSSSPARPSSTCRCQFHQHFTYSFYTCRSQKHKKIQLSHHYLFTLTLSGSSSIKAVRRTLMKLCPDRSRLLSGNDETDYFWK